MELYVAEFHHAFTGTRRITLFYSREDWYENIARGLAGKSEFLFEVQHASKAMGLPTTYADIKYVDKDKKKFKMKYSSFRKKK
jgi:hypothetical protein